MLERARSLKPVRILCLLASSFRSSQPTATKRIIPLMRDLRQRGHHVSLQENLAMRHATSGQWRYLPARVNYIAQSLIRQNGNYDLIFGSKSENTPLAYLLSKKLRIPFVIDSDDLEKISALDIHGYGTSFLNRRAAKVFVASNELYKLNKRIRNGVVYLPNTTDLEHFNPEEYQEVERSSELTFLWVSDKIDWFTGCNVIFTSLARLKRGRVIIIGSGPRTYFKELSKKLGIARQVAVKDWIQDSELPKLYATCDIGLLPFSDNLWTRCKCPSRLFEFMAMCLPYICTVGEPAYMARKLGCGLIAKPETADFTDKMKYAIDHLEEIKEGAKRGREYLLEKQNFSTLVEKLEAELSATLIPR